MISRDSKHRGETSKFSDRHTTPTANSNENLDVPSERIAEHSGAAAEELITVTPKTIRRAMATSGRSLKLSGDGWNALFSMYKRQGKDTRVLAEHLTSTLRDLERRHLPLTLNEYIEFEGAKQATRKLRREQKPSTEVKPLPDRVRDDITSMTNSLGEIRKNIVTLKAKFQSQEKPPDVTPWIRKINRLEQSSSKFAEPTFDLQDNALLARNAGQVWGLKKSTDGLWCEVAVCKALVERDEANIIELQKEISYNGESSEIDIVARIGGVIAWIDAQKTSDAYQDMERKYEQHMKQYRIADSEEYHEDGQAPVVLHAHLGRLLDRQLPGEDLSVLLPRIQQGIRDGGLRIAALHFGIVIQYATRSIQITLVPGRALNH